MPIRPLIGNSDIVDSFVTVERFDLRSYGGTNRMRFCFFFWQGFSSQKSGWKEQGKDIRDESAEKGLSCDDCTNF